MVIKVYISGISGNKEVKKRQQRVMMILESKNISYEVIDITEPGKESDKEFMQQNSKPRGDQKHPLPPQIFNDEEYCGPSPVKEPEPEESRDTEEKHDEPGESQDGTTQEESGKTNQEESSEVDVGVTNEENGNKEEDSELSKEKEETDEPGEDKNEEVATSEGLSTADENVTDQDAEE